MQHLTCTTYVCMHATLIRTVCTSLYVLYIQNFMVGIDYRVYMQATWIVNCVAIMAILLVITQPIANNS